MKISQKNQLFAVGAIIALFAIGLFVTTMTTPEAFSQCDATKGEVLLDDGTCLASGSLSNTIARANVSLSLFGSTVNILITIAVSLAFFYFFWNLVKYIRDEEGKDEAKTKMGYALIAIFVIVTLWGIVAFVRGVLGIGSNETAPTIELPAVGFSEVSKIEQRLKVLRKFSKTCSPNPSCFKPAYDILKDEGLVQGLDEHFTKNTPIPQTNVENLADKTADLKATLEGRLE